MEKRKIILFFSSEGKEVEYETAVTSFGQLCELVDDYDLSSKKVVDEETRHVFEAAEAILPVGDCVLYVYNRKSKAGAAVPKQFKKISPDKLHTFPLDVMRKFASFLNREYKAGINGKAAKDDLQKQLRKWMLKNSWPTAVATSSPAKASKSAKGFEKKVIEKAKETAKAGSTASAKPTKAPLESASQPGKSLPKRVGPVTLEIIDDKLDLILEAVYAKQNSTKTAIPISSSKEERSRRARELKGQFQGIQG